MGSDRAYTVVQTTDTYCKQFVAIYVFFQAKNVPKLLSAGALPRTPLRDLTMLPRFPNWQEKGTPPHPLFERGPFPYDGNKYFREGAHQCGGPRAPKGIKTALRD